ncbi:unnamed protein product [Arctogadus glacialis]
MHYSAVCFPQLVTHHHPPPTIPHPPYPTYHTPPTITHPPSPTHHTPPTIPHPPYPTHHHPPTISPTQLHLDPEEQTRTEGCFSALSIYSSHVIHADALWWLGYELDPWMQADCLGGAAMNCQGAKPVTWSSRLRDARGPRETSRRIRRRPTSTTSLPPHHSYELHIKIC